MPRYDLNGDPIPEEGSGPPPVNPASIPPLPQGYVPPPPGAQGYTAPPPGAPGYAPPPEPEVYPPGFIPPPGSSARPMAPRPAPAPLPPRQAPGYQPPSAEYGLPTPPPMPTLPAAYPPSGPGRRAAKPKAAVDPRTASIRWIAGGATFFVVLAVVILLDHPASVSAPTGFSTYTSPNGTFTVDEPNGWKVETVKDGPTTNRAAEYVGDDTDSSGVAFSSGSAKIAIYQGTVQSITGSLSQPLPASNLVRRYRDDVITGRFYSVDNEQNYDFTTEGFGDGFCETWSAPGPKWGLPNAMRGYYVAMSGGNYYVLVDCECRQSDWPTLKSAFVDVVGSLTELPAPGYQPGAPSGDYPSAPPPQKHPPINTTPGL